MEHTRFIRFNFHDNDYSISATEVIKRVFSWHMFTVNLHGCPIYEHTFEERWSIFDRFIEGHYAGKLKGFANHIADMIVLDSFTYNIIRNDFACYDDMLGEIKSLFNSGNCNYISCDIRFVNEIGTEEDWNSETIYLDMTTGYIEVR